jgi:hypothetical protein
VHHTAPVTFQWTHDIAGATEVHEGTGICPECGCTMTKRYTFGQHTQSKGGFLNRRKGPGSKPFSTLCLCTSLHTGRPEGVRVGCGARITIASWEDGATP